MTNLNEISRTSLVALVAIVTMQAIIPAAISTPIAPTNRQAVKGSTTTPQVQGGKKGLIELARKSPLKRITPPVVAPTTKTNSSQPKLNTSEPETRKFQPRMMQSDPQMAPTMQQQQQQQQPQQHQSANENYFGNVPDSWHAQNLMPTFTDQEQGDEMVAVASDNESESIRSPGVGKANSPSHRDNKADESQLEPAATMAGRREPEAKQMAVGRANSGNGDQATRFSSTRQRAPNTDDYYPDEELEDEEELGKPLSRDEYESSIHEPPKESHHKYHMMHQKKAETTDKLADGVSKPPPMRPAALAADSGWLPTSGLPQSQTGGLNPMNNEQHSKDSELVNQLANGDKRRSRERFVDLFGNQNSYGGPVSKTDAAIEYLRNILRSKQNSTGPAAASSMKQYPIEEPISKNPRFESIPTRLSDILNSTAVSQQQSAINSSTLENLQYSGGLMPEAHSVSHLRPNDSYESMTRKNPQQTSEQQQQSNSKFSIGDAKPLHQTADKIAEQNTFMFSLSSTTRQPSDERTFSMGPQMISLSDVIPERVAQPNSMSSNQQQPQFNFELPLVGQQPNGTPLGGDYIESLDDFPRPAQQPKSQPAKASQEQQPLQLQQPQQAQPPQQLQLQQPQQQQQQPQSQQQPQPKHGAQMQQGYTKHLSAASLISAKAANDQRLFEEGLRQSIQQQQLQHQAQFRQQQLNAPSEQSPNHPQQAPASESRPLKPTNSNQPPPRPRLPQASQDFLQSVFRQANFGHGLQANGPQQQPSFNYQPSARPAESDQPMRPLALNSAESQIQHQVMSAASYRQQVNISSELHEEPGKRDAGVDGYHRQPVASKAHPVPIDPHQIQHPPVLASGSKLYRGNVEQPPQPPTTQKQQQSANPHPPQELNEKQSPPKIKPPKIVSYNYFESPNEPGESELLATNYQLGDSLLSSSGGVEQVLSNTELEAIQNQFLTLDHPVVPLSDHATSYNNNQQQHQSSTAANQAVNGGDQSDASLAGLLASLKPSGLQPDALQKLTSSANHGEELMRESASNEEPTGALGPQQLFKQNLAKGTDDKKKKSLIVYLNHPRSTDMSSGKSQAAEELGLVPSIGEQPLEPFVTAKEFDSQGLSKDSKHLDISSLRGFGGEAKDGMTDKDGLSVVVIGDAYKYKKIVLLISSKSGGLKFIPMVKDMKK